jgi:hypothetical protein
MEASRKRSLAEAEQDESNALSHGNPLVEHVYRMAQQHAAKTNVELEVRLCLHCGPNGMRIRLPIETPAVLSSSKNPSVGVSASDFERIKAFLDEKSRSGSGSLAATTSHTRDMRKGDFRESVDVLTGSVVSCCRKRRLFVVDVTCPRLAYDLRVAMNEEIPADAAHCANMRVDNIREKKRITYALDGFNADLTQVVGANSNGTSTDGTFEVELDFSTADSRTISPLTITKLLDSSFAILLQLKRAT